jgi:hypothetical protein
MTDQLLLVPYPKRVTRREGTFSIAESRYTQLIAEKPAELFAAACQSGLDWEITASPSVPKGELGLLIRLDLESGIDSQGYKLTIRPERIEIVASDPAGAFYGSCTLRQLIRQFGKALPCLAIVDSPDFPERGVMLDISRDKVPTMETLRALVDMLAEWKINQFQLYTEHTFAYPGHREVWKDASPMTGEEIIELDAYCESKFIDLVPNQNSFGHMERWLKHDRYRPMAESPNGGETAWGYRDYPFSLCPIDRRSIPFVGKLFDDLLPHFSSKYFNVGCDETVDLGYGRSKKACKERGTGRVYLDFLLSIYREVTRHGRKMQFWWDIILHYPELVSELPKDVVALEWGYEANHPFAKHAKKIAESGLEFYVCPGTSSWNTLVGRTENAIVNITTAAKVGKKHGARGLLNTDWGDYGHWQPLSVAYLGYMVGAAASWNAGSNVRNNLVENLSLHAFGDPSSKTGRAFYDLGDLYRIFPKYTSNHNVQWKMLQASLDDPAAVDGLTPEQFKELAARTEEIASAAAGDEMAIPDAEIVREELRYLYDLMRLSTAAGLVRLGAPRPGSLENEIAQIKQSHNRVWLLRNRPGGMEDSLKHMGFLG